MIIVIGFITIGALVGLLVFCLANESEAEKRREPAIPAPYYIAVGEETGPAA